MLSMFRLSNRHALRQMVKNDFFSQIRPVTLKVQPAPTPKQMGHDERNMKLGRPQSPHLTIYAPQMTSLLSISHRATGMVMAGYTILFGASALLLPDSIPNYLDMLEGVNNVIILGVKFCLVFPLAYHYWNGVRHLLWDFGKFLNLKDVYVTGYAMLAATFLSAAVLTVL